jgi:hypothetical protein
MQAPKLSCGDLLKRSSRFGYRRIGTSMGTVGFLCRANANPGPAAPTAVTRGSATKSNDSVSDRESAIEPLKSPAIGQCKIISLHYEEPIQGAPFHGWQ